MPIEEQPSAEEDLGKIEEVIPSADGNIRGVLVKVVSKEDRFSSFEGQYNTFIPWKSHPTLLQGRSS